MTPWEHAVLALTLLAIDPPGLKGLAVRARISPVRDAFLAVTSALPLPAVRLHPQMSPAMLDGDLDVAATLGGGTVVMARGLLERGPSTLILPMAERTSAYMAARLAQSLDGPDPHVLIALDEGADADENLPAALADRIAFRVSLDGLAMSDYCGSALPADLDALRKAARKVTLPDSIPEQLVVLAVKLGITSLRAPSFALRAAQAHAALHHRKAIAAEDVTAAVALVYAHRATQLPDTDDTEQGPPPEPPPETAERQDNDLTIPDDVLLDAITAALPKDLLAGLAAPAANQGAGAGSGSKRTGSRKGRPLPARNGARASGARVDIIATLRTAVPWQTLRRQSAPESTRPDTQPIIRFSDLRHKRYQSLSDRLLIFTVDASGSAAMARLAEAKGAVELLLAEAYARRDHVSLISFRGSAAEVLLPPTRSLVQTKRRLAAIPGGGATPLAAGLTAAMTLAQTARRKGMTPTVIVLTDGRANIALNGQPDRRKAAQDAQDTAAKLASLGIEALVIDTTIRPEAALKTLADTMRAQYVALPRADAKSLSAAVATSLKD
ncbi:magnesium chelatase subunit D [Pseudosulfitobacter koreensis]|uniref:Mg-protoporphyrin IX chelatase n=1 Tax=Pseudosulfitobacter koreensis TaxID=2968472 RepID=A0ABT1YWH6_9RHOB|nr:magnesium chelatase subunit D [Pseudosulfitobacter koreense]MCR8825233.1 magnesium chelatase subunit D [Pseudosulfitobacter koreense]